ncbi:1-phosphofructokinase family hexose kinase [Spiroplasma alleghenense]|uniref:1-phosphofructokinase n=1 Tax=Spiroplasma alleghenense TaxID=216931 RepID=A0A345Z536_9MOLU|nr:1-phosphofructokinase family hexose kinase [Spiroplasma alleghenense]AXK51715.1 1-phosphofructokinase [Spiroplasma alleghenense]
MNNNIYVVSLSPAFDYILKFDDLVRGKTNRPRETELYPAGKGIHVSMLLNSLRVPNESLIFSNGKLEPFFYSGLDSIKIKYKKFNSEGDIRINVKLIDKDQTECSATAPTIKNSELEIFKDYLRNNIKPNDFVVVTGSVPAGVDAKIYSEIVQITNSLSAHCLVDAFGDSLNLAVKEKPFLIKPNSEELSLTTGIKITSQDDLIKAAKILLSKGVKNILISQGEEGAIFINNDIALKCNIGNWNKKLVNAAGAGDSMLAGFLSEYIKTKDYAQALKMGIVCGSATAYCNKIADSDLIDELLKSIDELKVWKI